MKKLKVKTKLVLVTIVSFLLLFGLNFSILYNNFSTTVEKTVTKNGISLIQTAEKHFDQSAYAEWAKSPVINKEYWELRKSLNDVREKDGALYLYTLTVKDRKPYLLIDGQPKDSKITTELMSPTSTTTYEDIQGAYENGRFTSAKIVHDKQFGNDYLSVFAPIKDTTGSIIGVLGMDIDAGMVNSITKDIMRETLPTIIGIYLVFLTIVIVFYYYMSGRVLKPLNNLSSLTNEIAKGNLIEKELKYKNKDEIGEIIQSFTSMRREIRGLIQGIQLVSSNINQQSQSLVNGTSDIKDKTMLSVEAQQAISESTNEISISMEKVQKASTDFGQQITNVSQSIGDIEKLTENVFHEGDNSYKLLQETITQNRNTKKVFGEFSTTMNELVIKTEQMEDILKTIEDIASKTNMLSLNAAIEAARAGRSGAGFAVVSSEIGKLSEQTAIYTKDISNKIRDIQAETDFARKKLTDVLAEYDTQNQKIETTSNSMNQLHSITDNLKNTLSKVVEYLHKMNKQQDVIQKEIDEVASRTEETMNSSFEVGQSMDKIKNEVNQMVEDVHNIGQEIEVLVAQTKKFTL